MKRALVTAVAGLALLAATSPAAATAAPAKPREGEVEHRPDGRRRGQFKTLVSLVKQAGLAGALSGKGPLTVFAPTDAAFAKVPKATLTALGKDKAKLKAVLLYHVVKGKVTAAQVVKLKSAKTLEGSSVADQGQRRQGLRRRRSGHQGRRAGIEWRHPRDQQGADPADVARPRVTGPGRRGLTHLLVGVERALESRLGLRADAVEDELHQRLGQPAEPLNASTPS